MARKRLLTLMLSAIFLLCFVGSALAAGPARRYVGSSTAKGAIYQSSYRVDAQSLTGVKSINISATLYENGNLTIEISHSNIIIAPKCLKHLTILYFLVPRIINSNYVKIVLSFNAL